MLINNEIDYIKKKLRKYTNDKDLIDELAQIISIKLYERSYDSENDNQSKKLISLLIRSSYIDYYRSNKNKKWDELDIILPAETAVKINYELLFKIIDGLPEKQRDVIILRYYFKLKYIKIGELFNCSKNTALSYFHKAKRNIKKIATKDQLLNIINT